MKNRLFLSLLAILCAWAESACGITTLHAGLSWACSGDGISNCASPPGGTAQYGNISWAACPIAAHTAPDGSQWKSQPILIYFNQNPFPDFPTCLVDVGNGAVGHPRFYAPDVSSPPNSAITSCTGPGTGIPTGTNLTVANSIYVTLSADAVCKNAYGTPCLNQASIHLLCVK
jgi:hypothetical protein